ncbi:MAG: hypothetical protein ACREAE_09625, partial [Nitrosopumilaceae archaeon]
MDEEWEPVELHEGGVYDVTLSKSVRGVWTVRIKQANTTLFSTSYTAFILGSFPEKPLFRFRTRTDQTIFVDKEKSDIRNIFAGMFEHSVADYLREEYGYNVTIRYKPPYLHGKEIDIYAEKSGRYKTITACECKLRLNNNPITFEEIEKFNHKVEKIRDVGSIVGVRTFYFCFVTNAENIDPMIIKFTKEH